MCLTCIRVWFIPYHGFYLPLPCIWHFSSIFRLFVNQNNFLFILANNPTFKSYRNHCSMRGSDIFYSQCGSDLPWAECVCHSEVWRWWSLSRHYQCSCCHLHNPYTPASQRKHTCCVTACVTNWIFAISDRAVAPGDYVWTNITEKYMQKNAIIQFMEGIIHKKNLIIINKFCNYLFIACCIFFHATGHICLMKVKLLATSSPYNNIWKVMQFKSMI